MSPARESVGRLGRVLSGLLHRETSRRCRLLESRLAAAQDEMRRLYSELMESRYQERLARHEALHDGLTGLPNRRFFDTESSRLVSRHLSQGQGLALMYIDLDGFKAINDQHGHSAGDALLRIIGARLSRCLRTRDAVSRHGGDEFLCVLRDVTNDEQAAAVARKLYEVISAHCQVDRLSLSVSPSIGIAMYPLHGADISMLTRQADQAMLRAKRQRLGYAFADQIPAGSSVSDGEARVSAAE